MQGKSNRHAKLGGMGWFAESLITFPTREARGYCATII